MMHRASLCVGAVKLSQHIKFKYSFHTSSISITFSSTCRQLFQSVRGFQSGSATLCAPILFHDLFIESWYHPITSVASRSMICWSVNIGEVGSFTRRVGIPSYLTVWSFGVREERALDAGIGMHLLLATNRAGGELTVAFIECLLERGEHKEKGINESQPVHPVIARCECLRVVIERGDVTFQFIRRGETVAISGEDSPEFIIGQIEAFHGRREGRGTGEGSTGTCSGGDAFRRSRHRVALLPKSVSRFVDVFRRTPATGSEALASPVEGDHRERETTSLNARLPELRDFWGCTSQEDRGRLS